MKTREQLQKLKNQLKVKQIMRDYYLPLDPDYKHADLVKMWVADIEVEIVQLTVEIAELEKALPAPTSADTLEKLAIGITTQAILSGIRWEGYSNWQEHMELGHFSLHGDGNKWAIYVIPLKTGVECEVTFSGYIAIKQIVKPDEIGTCLEWLFGEIRGAAK